MRLYICDDEEKILKDLCSQTEAVFSAATIKCFTSSLKLMKALRQEVCDILLLDIDMPDMDGMEVAGALAGLDTKPLLIFVTSHDELVYESFQFHPFGFVRKRLYKEELPGMLLDCKRVLESEKKYFTFRSEGRDVRLLLSEIMYFEADGNYLKIYTGQGEWRFRSTMTAVENTLQNAGYIRIHKGFLINQEKVRLMSSEEALLTDDTRLPVGKQYAENARKQLMRYMR